MSSADLLALTVAAALTLVPGLVLLIAVGLRGWVALGAAPVASLGVLGVAAVLAEVASLPWHPLAVLAVWAVVTATAAVGSRRLGGRPAVTGSVWSSRATVVVAAAVVVASVVIARPFFAGMGDLTTLFWNFDSAFHYNAARLVHDSGDFSQFTLDLVNNYSNPGGGFYPPLLYGLAALIADFSGVSIIVAVNAAVIACFAVVLPTGLVGLIHALGLRPLVAVGVALCAGIVEAYPVDSLIRGPIFPFAASVAFIPALLALLVVVIGAKPRVWIPLSAILGLGAAGAFLLHSSFPYSIAVFAAPLLIQLLLQRRAPWVSLGRLVIAGAVALVVAAPLLRIALGQLGVVTAFSKWEPDRTPSQALGTALTSSHINPYFGSTESVFPQWWLAALVLLGIVVASRIDPSQLWIVAAWVLATGLFVIAAGIDDARLRVLVGPWFSDRWRLWGLMGLAMIMLAGIALGGTLDFVYRRTSPQPAVAAVACTGIVAVFLVATNGLYTQRISDVTQSYFATSGRVLTDEETEAYRWLASQPDSDTIIMNQWVDGSALMLALEGLRPAWGTYNLGSGDEDRLLLWESFNELDTNAEVQRVVADREIRYVVVGETYPYGGGTLGPAPGLEGLDEVEGLTIVYTSPDTTIYRVSDQFVAGTSA